jgi:hypothetical protein
MRNGNESFTPAPSRTSPSVASPQRYTEVPFGKHQGADPKLTTRRERRSSPRRHGAHGGAKGCAATALSNRSGVSFRTNNSLLPCPPCLSGNSPRCAVGRRRGNHRGHRGHRSGFESPKALGAGSVSPGFSVVPFRQTRARLGYPHSNRAAAACVWLRGAPICPDVDRVSLGTTPKHHRPPSSPSQVRIHCSSLPNSIPFHSNFPAPGSRFTSFRWARECDRVIHHA